VIGKPLPAPPGLTTQLAEMSVQVVDGEGHELDLGRGSDLMGHPFTAPI